MTLQALKKRMKRLEQLIPSEEDKAAMEAHDAAWREVFTEYGVPLDTPVPNYYPPIIIRAVVDAEPPQLFGDLDLPLARRQAKSQNRSPSMVCRLRSVIDCATYQELPRLQKWQFKWGERIN